MKNILITGGAGFIGSHLADSLLAENFTVTAIDNFDVFYSKLIKQKNIEHNLNKKNYRFIEADITNPENLKNRLTEPYDLIIHLAAKAGIRPSIQHPVSFRETNIGGTQNLLEFAKEREIKQFIFASSSSVYGVNPNYPWKESDFVLMPISPYASTKVSCELLGHVYSHLYGIRFIGLRFFTVYGPRQRPDLAIHKFAALIRQAKEIPVFGDGATQRDYTYIDDIIAGVKSAINYDKTMYEIINLGNNKTVSLKYLISVLEEVFNVKAVINRLAEQPGDVPVTYADITKAQNLLDYSPKTSIKEGIIKFKEWFNEMQGCR